MQFCKFCENIMIEITATDKLVLECDACKSSRDASPEETLIISNDVDISHMDKSYIMLSNAGKDPMNSKTIESSCPNCNANPVKFVFIGNLEQCLYTCTKCEYVYK